MGDARPNWLPCLIIQTIQQDPSEAIWTDEASNVSRPDPSGADQIDAEHQATELALGFMGPTRTCRSCSGVVDRLGLRLVARDLQAAGAWHERRR
jgi:hypothetical protein